MIRAFGPGPARLTAVRAGSARTNTCIVARWTASTATEPPRRFFSL
ncbi:hypothetical protein [Streptomyces sp. NPDC012616]